MLHTFIMNGQTQLVLKPEKESEYALLEELLKQGPLVVEKINGNLSIMGNDVSEGLIIKLAEKNAG